MSADLKKALNTRKLQSGEFMVDAATAGLLLSFNTGNRRTNPHRIGAYADAMRRGEWQANGETVKFSKEGRLLDGQHRLHAVVRSEQSVPLYLMFDIDRSAFDTIDIGYKRTSAMFLSQAGYKNAALLGSCYRLLHVYLSGDLIDWSRKAPSPHQLLQLAQTHPGMEDTVSWHSGLPSLQRRMGIPTVMAFMHYAAHRQKPRVADAFFDTALYGEGIQRGDPAGHLRTALLDEMTRPPHRKRPRQQQLAYFIEAWRYAHDADKVSGLNFTKPTHYRDYEFPHIGKIVP